MSHLRPSIRFAFSVLAVLALAAPVLAQSYGPSDQTLTIGSTEFRPFDSAQTYGYVGGNYLAGVGTYEAPLKLPDGGVITQMCLYSYDPDFSVTEAGILAMKLPAGGQSSGTVEAPGSGVIENFNIGYGTVCTDPFSFTVRSDADLDGGGSEHLAYYVFGSIGKNSALGGVRITWHRQVSPAPTTAHFGDVPVGAFGFAQIEALFASGITGGCGGGNYCPNGSVTRAQMAVFLAEALGLYWSN